MPFSPLFVATCLISGALASIGPTADLTLTNGDVAPDGFTRQAGDEFNLNVVDQLTNETMLLSTSIHWHGFFQPNNSWADGVAFVTQCPIATFPTNEQAGTFWYHSHLSTQYCDGLRGPLVVYDTDDPYASLYESTIITLADCTLGNVPTLISTLINGLGRFAGGPTSQLAVISVTSGQRYRMRLVSMSCDPNFIFTIDGHTMTIIEADGVNTEPLTVDSIQIYAGQRYSFVLTADQAVDNYWIRTVANGGTAGFDNGINSAILRYVGANDTDPTTNATTATAALVETDLHPLVATAVPGTAVLSGAQSATDLLPSGSVFTLPANSVVELSIPGGTAGAPHPFHLHGHNFFVIKSAGNDTFNFDNPVCQRYFAACPFTHNAGPHIDFHLELGLALIFVEDAPTIANSTQTTQWDDLCTTYDALPSDEL
ncbi:laccase [Mycena olivaceomarginata]|nr:laccase [Mycena olivaceomarginata]